MFEYLLVCSCYNTYVHYRRSGAKGNNGSLEMLNGGLPRANLRAAWLQRQVLPTQATICRYLGHEGEGDTPK